MPTVFITGCSTGFGLETARLFLERDWNVVATMRNPKASQLIENGRLRTLQLDVADHKSIANAIDAAGPIDVLVNNAGIGWLNAAEGTTMATTRDLFETNTFGPMALIQSVLPQMRAQRHGVIVNVTSSATLKALPLVAAYTSSKAALNAFTESLAEEIGHFGLRAHIVLPGVAPTTAFADNLQGKIEADGGFHPAYADVIQAALRHYATQAPDQITRPRDVAEAVWRCATDPASPRRLPAGADAIAWAAGG